MAEKYVQVGITAMRDPGSGKFLPGIPLYVRAEDVAPDAEAPMLEDFARLLALRYKAYEDGCREAGVTGA